MSSAISKQYMSVTDRQTDGRWTTASTALMHSVAVISPVNAVQVYAGEGERF